MAVFVTTIDHAFVEALRDRYVLERELGHGGMATVYLARDLKHDRSVAFKILHSELAATLGPERFHREIQLAAGLQHPHILSVFDSGETAGRLWFTMPFVEGESLRARLVRERQLPVDDALRITADAARALNYAHQHGVIHRDIKPENLLLTTDGSTLVADFGIARALTGSAASERLTESGLAVGTPAYMSPEQASGDQSVDARTDIYSLGTVLYEMLAGEPPFTGPTAQAIQAKRWSGEVPRLRRVRPSVSEAVEQAVSRSLAVVPADRFGTAAEFIAALGLDWISRPISTQERTSLTPARSRIARPRARMVLLTAAALGLVVGAALWVRRGQALVIDRDLIAVAPFDVLDKKLQLWQEGMVDVLARSLDGAGSLRTVPPSVVIGRWRGRADAVSARSLGARTGAGLVVYGSLVGTGHDSVRASASLLDTRSGQNLGEIDRREAVSGMDRLADSVAFGLLAELSRSRHVGAFQGSGLGGRSLLALKAFLQGEQFMRAANYDSALAAYERAIALDGAFPQALNRASLAIGWSKNPFEPAAVGYALRAGQLNHGLSPRDSLHIALDSLSWAQPQNHLVKWSLIRRIFTTTDEAIRRYPNDPEAWYRLGEARWHFGMGPGINATNRQVLQAFDRAIALDSTFAPAYQHQIQLALELDGPARALVYLSGLRRAMRRDSPSIDVRMTDAALRDQRAVFEGLLDSASASDLSTVHLAIGNWPDSAGLSRTLLRSAERGRGGEFLYGLDSMLIVNAQTNDLLFRGQLKEACEERKPGIAGSWCGLLGGLSSDSTRAGLDRQWNAAQLYPDSAILWLPIYFGLPWWAGQRDTQMLARIASTMSRAQRRDSIPLAGIHDPYLLASVQAYLTLARGDTAQALERFRTLPDSLCPHCPLERLARAQLELARGAPAEALKTLEYRNRYHGGEPYLVLWELTRARAAEQVGDWDVAAQSYGFVLRAWARGDPPVQHYVEEAREGLKRLGKEGRPYPPQR